METLHIIWHNWRDSSHRRPWRVVMWPTSLRAAHWRVPSAMISNSIYVDLVRWSDPDDSEYGLLWIILDKSLWFVWVFIGVCLKTEIFTQQFTALGKWGCAPGDGLGYPVGLFGERTLKSWSDWSPGIWGLTKKHYSTTVHISSPCEYQVYKYGTCSVFQWSVFIACKSKEWYGIIITDCPNRHLWEESLDDAFKSVVPLGTPLTFPLQKGRP